MHTVGSAEEARRAVGCGPDVAARAPSPATRFLLANEMPIHAEYRRLLIAVTETDAGRRPRSVACDLAERRIEGGVDWAWCRARPLARLNPLADSPKRT